MLLDDLALRIQRLLDRAVRRLRLGAAPQPDGKRLLIVQIDGLSRQVFQHALATGRMPFVARLLRRQGYRLTPMTVGLPTCTPSFQMAAMYGVPPDIPGFHYHDKRRHTDVYFPRAGDAARVEEAHAAGRVGIVHGGSTYGCVFTGGAANNLFSFTMIKRPTGAGLLRAVAAVVVLGWATAKSVVLTVAELLRAALRFVADPMRQSARGIKWLTIKIGISVWLRQLFTLAVSRDLYAGVPVIYVNYLDYDVFGHAFGPRHRQALRALRGIDRSIRQLSRVMRRVPEHRYDLYILSDHGMAQCRPYRTLNGGKPIERILLDEHLRPGYADERRPRHHRAGVRSALTVYRHPHEPGIFQRFVNYLEDDFPWVLGGEREVREREGIRVIAAGPNTFVYFVDSDAALTVERLDERSPGLVDEISQSRGVGFVLARSEAGVVCCWRGKRFSAADLLTGGPFAERPDVEVVVQGIRDLMTMPSAGDLVIYGHGSPDGNVSYVSEIGAHAGPAPEELHTFLVAPPDVALPAAIRHPLELYQHFVEYQRVERLSA